MSYVIKRKFQGLLGDEADSTQLNSFIQHIQTSSEGIVTTLPGLMDTLTVNHLIVKKTMKIPVGTDKYK